jgi:hypothetical protein
MSDQRDSASDARDAVATSHDDRATARDDRAERRDFTVGLAEHRLPETVADAIARADSDLYRQRAPAVPAAP